METVGQSQRQRCFRSDYGKINAVPDGRRDQAVNVGVVNGQVLSQRGGSGIAARRKYGGNLGRSAQTPGQGMFPSAGADYQHAHDRFTPILWCQAACW